MITKPCLFIGIDSTSLTTIDIKRLCQPMVAGVILFSRNYQHKQQLQQLCRSIKETNPQLQIATDHEGGRVQRFRKGFVDLPEPISYFNNQPPEQALETIYQQYLMAAKELKHCGIDINLVPVVDVDYQRSPIMQSRCFHQQPEWISQAAVRVIEAHHQAGLLTSAKHFPGHGFATADSHLQKTIDPRPLSQIETDIAAYRPILSKVSSIMMAHISYPLVDSRIASFSTFWINSVLRQNLHFKGRIFCDDLDMQGCWHMGAPQARIEKALEAGCSDLIWGNNLHQLDALLKLKQ